jgi:hypothetical protein
MQRTEAESCCQIENTSDRRQKREEQAMNHTSNVRAERSSQEYDPNETVDSFQKRGANAVNRIKEGIQNSFLAVLLGSLIVSLLTGYLISRHYEAQKRAQWAEIFFCQVKNWLGERGRKATAPVQESLESARSAPKHFSRRGAEYRRRLNPFSGESRRRFLGIF